MKIKTKYRLIKSGFKLSPSKLYREIAERVPISAINSLPIVWRKAKDFSVWDDQGNKFIDLTSGIFVANAGHANPLIKQAIKKQLDADLLFAYNYPTEIKNKFIKKLLSVSPKHFNRVILVNSGSEANQIAYKFIKLYGTKTQKRYIITFKGGYFGRGLSLDFMSKNPENASWSRLADPDVIFLDFPYDPSTKFDGKNIPVPASEIAAFMLETFQGSGAYFYPKGFVRDLCAFAKKHGALVCFDELQSGFYRLGQLYGYATYDKEIKPDIVTLGKGMAPLPLGAVLTSDRVFNVQEKLDLYGTQSGNAVCLAAALANLEFLSDKKNLARIRKIIKIFEREIGKLSSAATLEKVNVRGMMAGLIFKNKEDAAKVAVYAVEHGVLPVKTSRNFIKIAPPLTISEAALKEALEVIKEALR